MRCLILYSWRNTKEMSWIVPSSPVTAFPFWCQITGKGKKKGREEKGKEVIFIKFNFLWESGIKQKVMIGYHLTMLNTHNYPDGAPTLPSLAKMRINRFGNAKWLALGHTLKWQKPGFVCWPQRFIFFKVVRASENASLLTSQCPQQLWAASNVTHHSWIRNDNCLPFSRCPETLTKSPSLLLIPDSVETSALTSSISPRNLTFNHSTFWSSALPHFLGTTFSYFLPSFLSSPWFVSCLLKLLSTQTAMDPQLYASPSVLTHILMKSSPHLWTPPPSLTLCCRSWL